MSNQRIIYKPESFDVTVVRPRAEFTKIDDTMPFFKDTTNELECPLCEFEEQVADLKKESGVMYWRSE